MSITLNKDAYKQLIQQDLDFLSKHCPDTPELDHIKLLVSKSIDDLYPEKPQKKEVSTLKVLDKMVETDNKEIHMTSTIVSVSEVSQGSVVGFGVINTLGNDAKTQMNGLPGEYIHFYISAKLDELAKTRESF